MRKCLLLLFIVGCGLLSSAQNKKPKLVVGIMVDQMRWDYLYRYQERFGPGGFKRLMNEGFNCANTLIPYTPTYTAPGHASVYTGSVPSLHGIAGNFWYDRKTHRSIYCTEDDSVQTVGSTGNAVSSRLKICGQTPSAMN
jgi:predicted AlkP superfamily pyrophosphatase or phosphodiesterase